jgi:stalled ribosome rescue protein Dom34
MQPDKQRRVVFLTESGHPPTPKTQRQYLDLFADADLNDKESMQQDVVAGPIYNKSSILADLMEKNPDMYIAVLYDQSKCQLVSTSEILSGFIEAIRNSSKTSWRIVMDLINQT